MKIYKFIPYFLVILTFATFFPSLQNGFVHWDDPTYLLNNPLVHELSWSNIHQVFRSYVVGNYHPLTLLTFMIEHHFWGLDPFGYHLNNVILHILNVVLVYVFVRRMSNNTMMAVLTSVLFAIHPMRVESVAWVTARKDMLFALFYLGGLISYLYYRNNRQSVWLNTTFLLFFLSLSSKPSAMTFPLVLMFIDGYQTRKFNKEFFLEKIPFFMLSIIFGCVALYGNKIPFNNLYPVDLSFTAWDRLGLIGFALSQYIIKVVWPFPLSSYYPYPFSSDMQIPNYVFGLSFIAILMLAFIFWRFRSRRIVVFGLGFFLCTIAVNLPLFAVGHTIIADRFTYLPYLGLFFILAAVFESCVSQKTLLKLMIILVALCSLVSWERSKVWRNDFTLWTDVVLKYPQVALGHYHRAQVFFEAGDIKKAIKSYDYAIQYFPKYFSAYTNRGNMYYLSGQQKKAVEDYNRALAINPKYLPARLNRGAHRLAILDFKGALEDYTQALEIDPSNPNALKGMKNTLEYLKQHNRIPAYDTNL